MKTVVRVDSLDSNRSARIAGHRFLFPPRETGFANDAMGKRRNTAKTGDKSMYSGRQRRQQEQALADARRGQEEESLKMDDDDQTSSDESQHVQQVLDLGAGGDSSSSSSSEDEDDDEEDDDKSVGEAASESSTSSDDDDSIEMELERQRGATKNWGGSKSAYYHGDTADLEIGQDEEVGQAEGGAGFLIMCSILATGRLLTHYVSFLPSNAAGCLRGGGSGEGRARQPIRGNG